VSKFRDATFEVAVGEHRCNLKIGREGMKGILSVGFVEEFNIVSCSKHIECLQYRSRGFSSESIRWCRSGGSRGLRSGSYRGFRSGSFRWSLSWI